VPFAHRMRGIAVRSLQRRECGEPNACKRHAPSAARPFLSVHGFAKLAQFLHARVNRWAAAHFLFVPMNRSQHAAIERAVQGLGYEFVHLEWIPRGGLVRVYIDGPNGVGVEDCARVSEHLSRTMAVEGLNYDRLEVSSPGLDRPLAKEEDFIRFVGRKARVVLRVPIEGRKNITGTLSESPAGTIRLAADNGIFVVELSNVDKARLVPEL